MKANALALIFLVGLAGCSNGSFSGGAPSADKKGDGGTKTAAKEEEEDKETDQADDPVEAGPFQGAPLLNVVPEEIVLFLGEEFQMRATLTRDDVKDVTTDCEWNAGESDDGLPVTIGASNGLVTAVKIGDTEVKAALDGQAAKAIVHVVRCKATKVDESTAATSIKIDGENWPNNTVDPGGGDKDDYHVTITGNFLVDGLQIYAKDDQDITVEYALGTPGSTTQTVLLAVIDCDGAVLSNDDVSSGSGTHVLKAKKGQRFTLITTAVTGAQTRKFQLDKDTPDATAEDSFRVTAQ